MWGTGSRCMKRFGGWRERHQSAQEFAEISAGLSRERIENGYMTAVIERVGLPWM